MPHEIREEPRIEQKRTLTAKELAKIILRGGDQLWHDMQYALMNISQTPSVTLPRMNYDDYWRTRGRHAFQPRYRIIAELIEPGSTVLDIGCGDGWLLDYLSQIKDVKGWGIDISAEAVRMAQARGVAAEIGDVLTWQPDKEYDYIILSDVLEHLPNPEDALDKVRCCFRRAIIVSIPNIGYYPHRLRLLFGRFPIQWSLHPAEHLRFWTVIDFSNWIHSCSLQVAGIYSSNGFLLLHKYWPNLFSHQVVFVIRKLTSASQQ